VNHPANAGTIVRALAGARAWTRARSCAGVLALLVIPAVAFSGCLSGKRISDIDAPTASATPAVGSPWVVPPGVVVAPARRGEREIDGLYPATDPQERCCWLAPSAVVAAEKPAGAGLAIVTVYVPDYPFFETRPQNLTIAIAGSIEYRGDVSPGVHRLRVALPAPNGEARTLRFTMHIGRTFVPYAEHLNGDHRALGLILLSITFG